MTDTTGADNTVWPYVMLLGIDGNTNNLTIKLHSGDNPPSALAQILKPYMGSLLQKGVAQSTRTFTLEQILRQAKPDATIPTNYVETVDLCVVERGNKKYNVLVITATPCGYQYIKDYYKMDSRGIECPYTALDSYHAKLKADIPLYVQDVLLKYGLIAKRIK